MSRTGDTIRRLHSALPAGVELVAVSKFHPAEAIREAYDAGQRIFGESRVAELCEKVEVLPDDIRWHFIGHLQTNKVKHLIGKCSLTRLLELIDSLSERAGVVTRVLMQLHVAAEETKFGFTPDELVAWFAAGGYRSLKATHICGLMSMATNTDDRSRVAADFALTAATRRRILEAAPDLTGFDTLSMGMSDDYELAIAEGSTMIRIGTAIFGERQ